jgi:NAD(P)-dependent dehydrogenase (short-subunit alcohol dehydrogenase family)
MRVKLHEQGTTVTALHVAYMDTDMTSGLDVPKADPRQIARQTADAILAGEFEVLADETTRAVKAGLSREVIEQYKQLAA